VFRGDSDKQLSLIMPFFVSRILLVIRLYHSVYHLISLPQLNIVKLQPRLQPSHLFLRPISKYFPKNLPGLRKSRKLALCNNGQKGPTHRILWDCRDEADTSSEILNPGDVLLHIFHHLTCGHRLRGHNICSRHFLALSI
jgi:hypothetical protein